MPRKPRTQSGAPGQGAVTPVGVPYGEGERALESQRRMPVPDFASGGGPGGTPALPPAAPGGGGGGGAPDMNAVLELARQMPPPESIMAQPTTRPMEEVTKPLRTHAPGTGQRVVPNEAIYELRALAQRFPYPGLMRFLALVEEEGRQ